MKKTVLVTGAGGLIGSLIRKGLADKYTIRSQARHPIEGVETIVADICDMDAMLAACQGVDSVVHMAANARHLAPWEEIAPANIQGTYTVFEAAYRAGVKQIIFASSNHAVGMHDLEHAPSIYETGQPVLDHLSPVRPDTFYGVSKVFGEALGRYYADRHGMHVICLRIGTTSRQDFPQGNKFEPLGRLAAIWLSQRDCVQLVDKCLQAEQVKYDIFYGISRNEHAFYDLEHVRSVIGYEPQDSAEERLARVQDGSFQIPSY